MKKNKIILIIGGHDPTGGAGITADVETAKSFNYHSLSILTCATVQNTSNFKKVYLMPKNYIIESYKKMVKEFKIDVIKIGLLPTLRASKEVFEILKDKKNRKIPIIIDPIIKSGSNKILTSNANLNYIIKNIYPLATLLTPNLYEYKIIKKNKNFLNKNSIKNILITNYIVENGKITIKLNNYLNKAKFFLTKEFNRNFHGTGCTFATALACNISISNDIEKSIKISLTFMKKVASKSKIKGKKQFLLNRNDL